jgi:hypothetical protein
MDDKVHSDFYMLYDDEVVVNKIRFEMLEVTDEVVVDLQQNELQRLDELDMQHHLF